MCRGKILFIDDLVTYESKLSDGAEGLEAAFREAVDDYVETCAELGREPQKSLSGTFNVRITPELHKAARLRAVEDDATLNEVVAAAIHCYVNGGQRITNHSHNHFMVAPDDHMFDVYSAAFTAADAYKGAVKSVLQ
ncbi:type II toxin-antitoxin system HicB family antitoxin [Stenotrophomonas maltophilia]|nr:type II toxin-antitoxin system HicB family antitoxin [Stenotrophomonas maltophilia]MBH1667480.1 type II toxin-antitoxin system HicB family antitoxin [Stenotrophomonas maltophilia]